MADKEKKIIEGKVELPEGVTATVEGSNVKISGKKGEVSRIFDNPYVTIESKDNSITLTAKRQTKREKKIIGTFKSIIQNMVKGASEGHKYVLKICSGHFPMNVALKGDELVIKNFLGEKSPRVLKIKKGAEVKVEGDKINVESTDKNIAGQVSADIELLTKRPNYDARIFQDGIYIINKDGKDIS